MMIGGLTTNKFRGIVAMSENIDNLYRSYKDTELYSPCPVSFRLDNNTWVSFRKEDVLDSIQSGIDQLKKALLDKYGIVYTPEAVQIFTESNQKNP